MANPPNLTYCKITGNFKAFVADSLDEDDLPDFVPMVGSGSLWPNATTTRNSNPLFKSTYFNSAIPVTVDEDGDLSRNGVKYVMVLAESPDLNPSNFNYSIILNLVAIDGTTRQYGPFAFEVIPNGEVDLTDVIPVSSSSGTPIVRGLQGEPGDLVAVSRSGNWSGAVTLDYYPQTYLATLTGNVTSLTLPSGFYTEQSGTITLVVTQDATGGRTITWPSEIKWSDGIVQQPSTGAGTVSVFHLLWTGSNWLGLLGGKSFA